MHVEPFLQNLASQGRLLGWLCTPYQEPEDPALTDLHRMWALMLLTQGPLAVGFVTALYVANPDVGVRAPTILVVALLVIIGYALNRSPLFRWSPDLTIAGTFAAIWWNAWSEPQLDYAYAYYTFSLMALQASCFILALRMTVVWFVTTVAFGIVLAWLHPELSLELLVFPVFLFSFVTLLTLVGIGV